ncbi:MAG: hypothetical protein DMF72_12830 [Acidobacteria bacterium]|nr:MAG: hypothetical protein DMF72_12830 [Acidobacteriota bacterium]
MRRLITRRRALFSILLIAVLLAAAWIYWNRLTRSDLSAFAPSNCLAFVEGDDLAALVTGIEQTEAWRTLSGPLAAPQTLLPNRWLLRLARWTGTGSADTILFARSQVGVVFTGAEASQSEATLTIKPLATFIVETHTSQGRMKPAVERHIEDLARRVYRNPGLLRKQIDGIDLEEWISDDKSHQIVFAFVDTTVIVGNDESTVLHSIEAHNGKRASLRDAKEFAVQRNGVGESSTLLFGYISQSGVRSLLQAFVIYRGGSSADAITTAPIFADTFGALVNSISWTSRLADGSVEDRCQINLPDDVAEKLRSMVPQHGFDLTKLSFIPSDAYSFSNYQLRDPATFWSNLNAVVSSHADLIGSVAARPILRGLLKPYGIDDPDTFARAIGPNLRTIRIEENSPSVLIVEAFDRQALRTLILKRLGKNSKSGQAGNAEIMVSSSDNFAAAFIDNYVLLGPAEAVRRCLATATQSQSITSQESFRRAEKVLDVSLPFTVITFASDQRAAISFVEAFSRQERPAFATNAAQVDQAVSGLPYAVSVTLLKGSSIEWTSRSSFGLAGSLVAQFAPESK